MSAFELGLNLPWVACGHDFGPPPPAWAGARRTDFAALERPLASWRQDGIRVVRVWLLGGGVNYPVGRTAPWRIERGHYRGAPVPVGDAFLRDLSRLQTACANAGVRLVPSLLSFEAFYPVLARGGTTRGGLRHVILDQPQRSLATLLDPMLEVLDPRHVRAFELINEPDWIVRGGPLHAHRRAGRWRITRGRVERARMERWLVAGIDRLRARGFVPTVGFATVRPRVWSPGLLATLRREGLLQLHHYPRSPRALPRDPTGSAVIGEFASAPARWHPAAAPWPLPTEREPTRYLRGRLEHIQERGYAGAWLWSAFAKDLASRLGGAQRVQVRDFVRAKN